MSHMPSSKVWLTFLQGLLFIKLKNRGSDESRYTDLVFLAQVIAVVSEYRVFNPSTYLNRGERRLGGYLCSWERTGVEWRRI